MKKVVFLLLVLCAGLVELRFASNMKKRVASGFQDDFSEDTMGERIAKFWMVLNWSGPRLTPEGTYCLTDYVSVPTPSGPVGLLPGQQVRVVRVAGEQMIVTAPEVSGARELEVSRASLTEDMDLAGHIAARDRTAHRAFRDKVERDEANRESIRLGLYKEAAADLAGAERARMAADSGTRVGGRVTVLHQGSTSHGGGYYSTGAPVYYGVPVSTSAPAASRVPTGLNYGRTISAPQPTPANYLATPLPTPTPAPVAPTRW